MEYKHCDICNTKYKKIIINSFSLNTQKLSRDWNCA